MTNRCYLHGCPKDVWDKGIMFLPPEYKKLAETCISEPDLQLMDPTPVKDGYIYYETEKYSEGMDRVIQIYLETLAYDKFGSW